MSAATETCSCGAKIDVSGRGSDASVDRALAEWRTGHRHPEGAKPSTTIEPERPEHQPQGNNFSATERRSNFLEPDELNQQYRPGPYGRAISLKWWPPNG